MAVLYVAVFLVGVFASKGQESKGEESLSELMLAGRSLPLWVGLLTMTATWVGGGYINGTAEYTFSSGILWGAQAGIGFALSLTVGGLFFARIMRRHDFATLVDPLECRYGRHTAAVLMIPAVLAEMFWSAAILVALGSTFGTVIGLDLRASILASAAVAIAYTVFGGLRAVAYTDVVQMFLLLIGLGITIPYAIDAAGGWAVIQENIALEGFSSRGEAVSYGDWTLILILGGIPWNVYFQRVLSSRDEAAAAKLSISAGFFCALMAIPPLILGLCGAAMDWGQVADPAHGFELGTITRNLEDTPALVLPYILRLAVPTWVAVLGLGAVSAAVMSSVDSSILSASSLVAWNGYRRLINPNANAAKVTLLVRILVVVLGSIATTIALTVGSVAALWYLCGDVVYCVLFPQLTLALFDKKANRSGALAGLAVSVFLRLGGGDATLGLPAFLPYPAMEGGDFPFRTLAMMTGLVVALVVSRATTKWDPPKELERLGD